jgi:hypothetical protein
MEKRAPKPELLSTRALFPIRPGTPGVVTLPSTDFKSHKYRLARPVDVGFYFLLPISHAATPTGRGAYCFSLNVGDQSFGGEHERRDGSSVGESGAHDFGRIEYPGFD